MDVYTRNRVLDICKKGELQKCDRSIKTNFWSVLEWKGIKENEIIKNDMCKIENVQTWEENKE